MPAKVNSNTFTLTGLPEPARGASAVLGSQSLAGVPPVVRPGVFPQVEHLALKILP
ncbi:hypothetical protein [Brasilonema bromeliae]|uniref:hypothetical protein n=1 Tax=Brasilonema bromeliae TaxID=383615 RepID=UPI00145C7589